jgi:hypothetical protein
MSISDNLMRELIREIRLFRIAYETRNISNETKEVSSEFERTSIYNPVEELDKYF